MLDALHHFIVTTVGDYGYLAVFVLMVLESACIPIPSEVTMLFGGALATAGFAAPGKSSRCSGSAWPGRSGTWWAPGWPIGPGPREAGRWSIGSDDTC